MSVSVQRTSEKHVVATTQVKTLNAETATAIAVGFLQRIGNRGKLQPKKVALEDTMCAVEVEMKKAIATVWVNSTSHQIQKYETQPKPEETSYVSISKKVILMMFSVSAGVFAALHFVFKMLGL